jgi:WD40 repeat protein
MWDLAAGKCMSTLTQELGINDPFPVAILSSSSISIVFYFVFLQSRLNTRYQPLNTYFTIATLFTSLSISSIPPQHKKAVRSMVAHPREMSFMSGGSDNLKKWQCRDGKFLKNFSGHNSPINAMAVNEDGVVSVLRCLAA